MASSILLWSRALDLTLDSDVEFSTGLILGFGLLAVVLLLASVFAGIYLPNRIFDTDFVEYYDLSGATAKLRFKNKDYQALFSGNQPPTERNETGRSAAEIFGSHEETES